MPRDELRYSSYNQIQWVNSYTTWNISKDFQFVIVAQSDWIMTLAIPDREVLFRMQYEAGRGLVFPLSYFSQLAALPKEHIINVNDEQVIVIQKDMWMKLPTSYQEEAIKAYAQEYDDWTSTEIPANIPAHLRKYANTFSTTPGADKTLDSDYADMNNISSLSEAGSITAALFLRRFVPKDSKWLHVDMAGPMEKSSAAGYYAKSATGYGARLLADFTTYVSK